MMTESFDAADDTVNPETIRTAYARIAPHIRKTPVLELEADALGTHPAINLKLECLQRSGSFKARGAFNTLLSVPVPEAGVTAASGGNHGAAVAHAARHLGVPAHIFVPTISSAAKVEKIRAEGAEVVVEGAVYAEAQARCEAFQAASGAISVHPYNVPPTLAGQGTLGLEWEAQTPDLDALLIAVGGGGLIGGVAAWFKGRVKLVAVESEGTPALHAALQASAPVDVAVSGIAADSLGATRVGTLPFAHLSVPSVRANLQSVLVSDGAVRAAQAVLWQRVRVASEPGGAAALAALLSGAYKPQAGERIGVLICGANVAPAQLA